MRISVNGNSKNAFEDFDQSHQISSQQNPSGSFPYNNETMSQLI